MARRLNVSRVASVLFVAAMLASSPQSVVASHDTLYVADGVAVGLGTSCDSPNYNTGDYGTDDDALRAALSESLDNARIKTIFICAGTYVFDEPLDMSESVGVRRLELRGAGRDLTVLDGQEATRFISAPMDVAELDYPCRSKGTFDVTLRDMTLEAFNGGADWGGVIWYNGQLRMVNVLATGNVADPGGSVIDNNGGCADILIIEDSEFEDNSTDGSESEGGTINRRCLRQCVYFKPCQRRIWRS